MILALNLAGGDTVLGRAKLKDHEHPSAYRDLRAVHDRAGENRELLMASAALPNAPLRHSPSPRLASDSVLSVQEVVIVDAGAMRARRLTAAPAQFLKELVRIGFGRDSLGDGEDCQFHISIMTTHLSFVK
jgi:hypothetical protein